MSLVFIQDATAEQRTTVNMHASFSTQPDGTSASAKMSGSISFIVSNIPHPISHSELSLEGGAGYSVSVAANPALTAESDDPEEMRLMKQINLSKTGTKPATPFGATKVGVGANAGSSGSPSGGVKVNFKASYGSSSPSVGANTGISVSSGSGSASGSVKPNGGASVTTSSTSYNSPTTSISVTVGTSSSGEAHTVSADAGVSTPKASYGVGSVTSSVAGFKPNYGASATATSPSVSGGYGGGGGSGSNSSGTSSIGTPVDSNSEEARLLKHLSGKGNVSNLAKGKFGANASVTVSGTATSPSVTSPGANVKSPQQSAPMPTWKIKQMEKEKEEKERREQHEKLKAQNLQTSSPGNSTAANLSVGVSAGANVSSPSNDVSYSVSIGGVEASERLKKEEERLMKLMSGSGKAKIGLKF